MYTILQGATTLCHCQHTPGAPLNWIRGGIRDRSTFKGAAAYQIQRALLRYVTSQSQQGSICTTLRQQIIQIYAHYYTYVQWVHNGYSIKWPLECTTCPERGLWGVGSGGGGERSPQQLEITVDAYNPRTTFTVYYYSIMHSLHKPWSITTEDTDATYNTFIRMDVHTYVCIYIQ